VPGVSSAGFVVTLDLFPLLRAAALVAEGGRGAISDTYQVTRAPFHLVENQANPITPRKNRTIPNANVTNANSDAQPGAYVSLIRK
jgi:hypothetical protein